MQRNLDFEESSIAQCLSYFEYKYKSAAKEHLQLDSIAYFLKMLKLLAFLSLTLLLANVATDCEAALFFYHVRTVSIQMPSLKNTIYSSKFSFYLQENYAEELYQALRQKTRNLIKTQRSGSNRAQRVKLYKPWKNPKSASNYLIRQK